MGVVVPKFCGRRGRLPGRGWELHTLFLRILHSQNIALKNVALQNIATQNIATPQTLQQSSERAPARQNPQPPWRFTLGGT